MNTNIKYRLLSPVSHIGETASTGSYFQTVLTTQGRLPVITGNSTRGQIRDSAALHLLNTLNIKVDKEIFNVLFSGGNLSGTMRDDVERAKQIRNYYPAVSLLGGGMGTMIMAGKLLVSFGYPVCAESEQFTGIESAQSWHEMIEEIEFTRTDDTKNDVKAGRIVNINDDSGAGTASTQMRYSVQYIAAGTEIVQNLITLDGITPLEIGALYAAICEWFKVPRLGGMAAKGFGLFDAVVGDRDIVLSGGRITLKPQIADLIDAYEAFVREEGGEHLSLLAAPKGGKKGGKKANNAD